MSGKLGEHQAAFWSRDGTPKFLSSLDPFLNDYFYITQSLLIRCSIGGTARQLGNLRDESPVLVAPIYDDFIPDRNLHCWR